MRTRGWTNGAASLVVVTLLLAACSGCWDDDGDRDCPGTELPDQHPELVTIEQGIWGDVWFWRGDFMPGRASGVVFPVSREMRIYEVAGFDDVELHYPGGFYSDVRTPLVATVQSGENGFFEAALPPGRYSLFAVEDSLLYANGGDGQGNIYPVTVDSGQVVGVTFDITYDSTW